MLVIIVLMLHFDYLIKQLRAVERWIKIVLNLAANFGCQIVSTSRNKMVSKLRQAEMLVARFNLFTAFKEQHSSEFMHKFERVDVTQLYSGCSKKL